MNRFRTTYTIVDIEHLQRRRLVRTNDAISAFGRIPIHPLKLIVYCAIREGGVTGPYFFKENASQSTEKVKACQAMIRNDVVPQMNVMDVNLEELSARWGNLPHIRRCN